MPNPPQVTLLKYRFAIRVAAQMLDRGAVIGYPTEAVWGLGCDPFNEQAIGRLLLIKNRSPDKGLIQVASSIEQFEPYLSGLDSCLIEKMEKTWPGPVTWLVPDNGVASRLVCGKFSSIALRVSAHPLVGALCEAYGGPIISTSANISGELPPIWPWQLQRKLGKQLDYIVGGSIGDLSRPTEIRNLISDEIVRSS